MAKEETAAINDNIPNTVAAYMFSPAKSSRKNARYP
jgi:hypothetical protein